jgi:molecular chaperone GrpE
MQDETERAEPETAAAAPDGQSGPGPRQAAGADDAGAESAAAAETTEASEADGTGGQEAAAPNEAAPDEGASDEADGNEAADEATEAGEAGDHEVGADEVGDEAGADEVGDAPEADGALRDQLLRALADAENARRRARKDVEEARTYAISRFAQDLLGVADNLGRALASIPAERRDGDEAVKAIADGVEMTAREFEAVLARHGITRIDPLGEKFDYNYHQALFETADTDQPDGTVVHVLQTGYRIGDRLLREAMVGVAKGGAGEGDAGEGDVGEGDAGEAGAGSEAEGAQAPADDPA